MLQNLERLSKIIANNGYCSRRAAENLILSGVVKVNKQIIDQLGQKFLPNVEIEIDGKILKPKQGVRVWIFYKPQGLITTHNDPQNRMTVFEYIKSLNLYNGKLISAGRLDINSEGLLIITNDSCFARKMEHPSSDFIRKYKVRAFGKPDLVKLKKLEKPIIINNIKYQGAKITLEKTQNANIWLEVILKEGKNREVRKLLEYAGLKVNRLIRTEYGPYKLGGLKKGEVCEVEVNYG